MTPENPLTARVTVNRFWQEVFGTGIVKTSEDFGIMGEAPSHPELLDWLAVEFRESGWDMKHIVQADGDERGLSSGGDYHAAKTRQRPRESLAFARPAFSHGRRNDARLCFRRQRYHVAQIRRPAVKPYNPDGLWDVVGMPGSDTRKYEMDKGENLYRRSVYNFWKRMSPPANLEIFNAPAAKPVACAANAPTRRCKPWF